MKSLRKLSRRGLVRVISFTMALIAALTAAAIGSFIAARHYRTTIEYTYQRALSELTEYINKIDVTMEKGQYATTAKQMQGLSTKLWQDSGYAKAAISQLPVTGEEITSTNKFLSQVGNYCISLSKQVSEGNPISEENLAALEQLSGYSKTIAEKLRKIVSDLESGNLKLGEVASVISTNNPSDQTPNIDSGFREIEESFTDYPTMIYDGPFSDHIQQQEPKFLKDKSEIPVEKAMKTAKSITGVSTLERADDTEGNLPCYNFNAENLTISVTKTGGLVDYFINSRQIAEPTLSVKDAIKTAEKALEKMELTGFANRYYCINNGILTVNFAATQNKIICYPDLVKVGIALDDGSVVSYDAKGYIQNHFKRDFSTVTVTQNQARDIISSRLNPVSHAIVLIPSEGLTEILCHEFLCKGKNDENVLVYINTQTGMEEKILIIIEDETGVLAM